MLLKLSIARCDTPDAAFPLDSTFGHDGGTIGRGSANTLVIADPKMEVSRQHAAIEFRDGAYVVTDTSRNGLSVNGQVLGNGNSARLREGDRLLVGGFEIVASLLPEAGASGKTPDAEPPEPGQGSPNDSLVDAGPTLDAGPQISLGAGRPADIAESAAASAKGLLDDGRPRDVLDVLDRADPFAAPPERRASMTAGALDKPAEPASADREPRLPLTNETSAEQTPATHPDPARSPGDEAAPLAAAPALPPDWKNQEAETDGETYEAMPGEFDELDQREAAPTPSEEVRKERSSAADETTRRPDDSTLLEALKKGIGVPELDIDPEEAAVIMEIVGHIVRESVQGVRRVLIARNEIKDTFRLSVTRLQKVENNPLKFSVSAEDALIKLLQPNGKGYLPPADSMREVFRDLEIHEIAVITGMRAAVERILSRFEPDALERRLEAHFLDSLVPATRKAKLWELFTEHYQDIHREARDAFDHLYGGEFADAYEAEIRALKIRLEKERQSN